MRGGLDRFLLILVLLLGLLLVGFTADELGGAIAPDQATVTIHDQSGSRLATVDVGVADTFRERYVGLSRTASLGPNEGLLFVHGRVGRYSYVMRGMAFPIDIVFIDADYRITTIHHAAVEAPPYTPYRGHGKWILEVSYEYTIQQNISIGDRVTIEYRS